MPDGRAGRRRPGLDTPLEARRGLTAPSFDPELFGRWSERFARFMGTAWFLVGMTIFVAAWLAWNTWAPANMQFDPKELNYTLLTLILSLQASYAAPLILLAQNRQDDRDRVSLEQDRQGAERNLADTEFLAREMAALRLALGDVVTRDYLRSELRDLLEELDRDRRGPDDAETGRRGDRRREPKKKKRQPDASPSDGAGSSDGVTDSPEGDIAGRSEPDIPPPNDLT
jgi:uncharacterized membrane protein